MAEVGDLMSVVMFTDNYLVQIGLATPITITPTT